MGRCSPVARPSRTTPSGLVQAAPGRPVGCARVWAAAARCAATARPTQSTAAAHHASWPDIADHPLQPTKNPRSFCLGTLTGHGHLVGARGNDTSGEGDGESVQRRLPSHRLPGSAPSGGVGGSGDEVQALERGLFGREVPPGPDRPPVAGVEAFDGVGWSRSPGGSPRRSRGTARTLHRRCATGQRWLDSGCPKPRRTRRTVRRRRPRWARCKPGGGPWLSAPSTCGRRSGTYCG